MRLLAGIVKTHRHAIELAYPLRLVLVGLLLFLLLVLVTDAVAFCLYFSDGMEAVAERLAAAVATIGRTRGVVGVNLAKNTEGAEGDYVRLVEALGPHVQV